MGFAANSRGTPGFDSGTSTESHNSGTIEVVVRVVVVVMFSCYEGTAVEKVRCLGEVNYPNPNPNLFHIHEGEYVVTTLDWADPKANDRSSTTEYKRDCGCDYISVRGLGTMTLCSLQSRQWTSDGFDSSIRLLIIDNLLHIRLPRLDEIAQISNRKIKREVHRTQQLREEEVPTKNAESKDKSTSSLGESKISSTRIW
jgi:hypothetical protein